MLSCLFFLHFFFNGSSDYKKNLSAKTTSYIEGLRVVSRENGIDSWIMAAKKAELTADEAVADMKSVTMNIIKEGIELNADAGVYNMNTRDLTLKDNIKIRTKSFAVSAKNLTWNPSRETLTTDDEILIYGSKFKIEGEGLTATQDNKVTLRKNVKATFF